MTTRRQAGDTAEHLAAENIMLARTITRLALMLGNIAFYEPMYRSIIEERLERESESIALAERTWPPVGEGE